MTRYGKKQWNDELDDMKAYRADRKYRGHKLAVAVGHNKMIRDSAASTSKRRTRPEA